MLLRDARIRDEHGLDFEKTGHRTIEGERISDERTKNRRAERGLKLLEDEKPVNRSNAPEYYLVSGGLAVERRKLKENHYC